VVKPIRADVSSSERAALCGKRGSRTGDSDPKVVSVLSVSACRSPACAGEVIEENATDGHCRSCGLHHHRRAGTAGWQHVVGPLFVTLSGGSPGDEEVMEADMLRFVGKYMSIDVVREGGRFIVSVPTRRLLRIDAAQVTDD
jgi:hypothetical protein